MNCQTETLTATIGVDLIDKWDFASGSLTGSKGNKAEATSDACSGGYCSFDSSSHINISHIDNSFFDNGITLLFWMNTTTNGIPLRFNTSLEAGNKPTFKMYNSGSAKGALLYLDDLNYKYFSNTHSNRKPSSDPWPQDKKWYLFGLSMKGWTAVGSEMYIDGKNVIYTYTNSNTNNNDANIIQLGKVEMQLDDLKIYNGTLSPEAIMKIYKDEKASFQN